MDSERLDRIRAAMGRAKLDALICRLPANVLLMSGHWPLIGWSFLLFPRAGKPTCVVPHCDAGEAKEELWEADCIPYLFAVLAAGNLYEQIAKALKQASAGKGFRRVGFEGAFEVAAPPWNAAEPAIPASVTRGLLEDVFGVDALVDATDMLDNLRARKTPAELEKLRRVNEIGALGLDAFCKKVEVGISGIELVAHVEHTIMTRGPAHNGARRVRAFAQVSTGAAETSIAYRPMVISTQRKLREGDLAVLELAVVADGFWCDRTRVRAATAPTDTQRKVYETVRKGQAAAIATVRAGVTAGEIDETARRVLRDAGYEKEFLHVTGHGLGLRYHEPKPLICPGNAEILEDGMVHTVEPGIYFAEMGGIRIEDNVAVTPSSCEVLGPYATEL